MSALDEIRVVFFQECEEQLQELESGLTRMDAGETDADTVNAVFRAVHSIKGGAGAFSLDALVKFAHVFETTLDAVRAGRLEAGEEVMGVMLRSADLLSDLVAAGQSGEEVDPERAKVLIVELERLIGKEPGDEDDENGEVFDDLVFEPIAFDLSELDLSGPSGPNFRITFRPRPELYEKANEATVLLRELSALGEASVTCDREGLPALDELDPDGAYLAWTVELTTDKSEAEVREIFEFAEWDCDLTVEVLGLADLSELLLPAATDVDTGFDVAALFARLQTEMTGGEASAEPEGAEPAEPAAPEETAPEPAAPKQSAEPAAPAEKPEKAEKGEKKEEAAAVIRVELNRVDRLIDLVGEMVTGRAVLAQKIEEAGLPMGSEVQTCLEDLERLTRDLQESVMTVRAQPVKSVFQRMPRLVREVASVTGKKVAFVTKGENTEVDKTVVERLGEPLTHMIRNAIDHGLESTEKRIAAGKPAEGTVTLAAAHRSGRIIIEISDDGGGINRARVRQIAIDKGLLDPNTVLTDEETDQLIMLPGFSTAATISSVSGRGVGMDVVKSSIEALGGRLSIASRPGLGSTFTMSLPLTLAVLEGMVVRVEEETLVVPLAAIVVTFRPRAEDLLHVGAGQAVKIRGATLPLVDVGVKLGYRDAPIDPKVGVAILVEGDKGRRVALLVDDIRGQRQVVIKSLEKNYRPVPGIAAATISGEGRVALIVDVDGMCEDRSIDEFVLGWEPVAAE
ncbi:chemotaxis protein CheA [Aurantimonas sp. Leaf443]|uniref:chemotaxis protein CheA n=1 Tax=Aurantimonas sp. Leaf443 TaxID=1736378 RepID=UPI0006F51E4E|nr:chemotaxis protein CheA [Aurantimonas sp. Leaf443]KQT86116.1 chemotaxis protein CheA [Aurantimonas sp. Leaf443]